MPATSYRASYRAAPRLVQSGPSWEFIWWGSLLVSIAVEGLGRRYLPVPGPVLYFAKDAVLLIGLVVLGRNPAVLAAAQRLAGLVPILLGATAFWCMVTLAFPEHPSLILGILGMRQYLLWWLAPAVVASAVIREGGTGRVEWLLAALALGVAGLAAFQFTQSPTEAINAYAWGNQPGDVATVSSTGRVRVTSTFSYISGFSNFVSLATPLLLAAGVGARGNRARVMLVAAGALAATTPMGGGRAAVLYVALGAFAVLGMSGTFRNRRGALGLAGLIVGVGVGFALAPEAAQGVGNRFDSDETVGRFRDLALVIPVVPILNAEYPPLGLGVGAMQNAAAWLGVDTGWESESEAHRLLLEVGVPGYLLVWLSRALMALGLIRAGRGLARSQARPWAGAAWAYAACCMLMPLTTDHVAQSLFFSGVGLILARFVQTGKTALPPRRNASA
jgi:hypothetical protein